MKIGSLCTGYGGLDMAVEAYFQANTVWCAEYDKHASKLISERLGYLNYGDISQINWSTVEPINILTAGYPCQPFSVAGNRQGSNDARHLWPYIKEAISVLRPRWVILENVRGHLSLGFKEVLKDLAEIGYDARWQIVRASDVGAPHQRARLFIIAYPKGQGPGRQASAISRQSTKFRGDISIITNPNSNAHTQSRRTDRGLSATSNGLRNGQNERQTRDEHRSSGEITANTNNTRGIGSLQGFQGRFNSCSEMSMQTAPNTLDQLGRLNPQFVEYMMGLPKGWVTDSELSRTQQLKMLGNGVVPQQAYYALEQLMKYDTPSEQDLSL